MMRRSGKTNESSVPAFFTRSRAKNFFNTSSNVSANRNGNKQQEESTEKEQERIMQSENKNSQSPKQKKSDQSPSVNEKQSPNTADDSQPEVIEIEMKQEEPEVKIEAKEDDNSGSGVKHPSATVKALRQLHQANDRKLLRKKHKIPLCERRRKLNRQLNKILTPKSAMIFLHELKPGCTYKFQDQSGSDCLFKVQVDYNGKVLAVGTGSTKLSAKNAAAESAIRLLVAEALTQQNVKKGAEQCESNNSAGDESMDTSEDLSLAGLASYAMYKMFTEWQNQGTDFPLLSFQHKKKTPVSKPPAMKKDLPPNADQLHPSFLLNTMRPGALSIELERSSKDNISSVTMGYEIEGKMYKGSGSNKKEARKRAAQAALADLYGLKYSDEWFLNDQKPPKMPGAFKLAKRLEEPANSRGVIRKSELSMSNNNC